MPNRGQLESLAEEFDVSLSTVKKYEEQAEDSVGYDEEDPKFHGTVYNIIKNKLHKNKLESSLQRFISGVFKCQF